MKNPKITVALGAISAVVGMVLYSFSPRGDEFKTISDVLVVNVVGVLLMFIGFFALLSPPPSPKK